MLPNKKGGHPLECAANDLRIRGKLYSKKLTKILNRQIKSSTTYFNSNYALMSRKQIVYSTGLIKIQGDPPE